MPAARLARVTGREARPRRRRPPANASTVGWPIARRWSARWRRGWPRATERPERSIGASRPPTPASSSSASTPRFTRDRPLVALVAVVVRLTGPEVYGHFWSTATSGGGGTNHEKQVISSRLGRRWPCGKCHVSGRCCIGARSAAPVGTDVACRYPPRQPGSVAMQVREGATQCAKHS